MKIVISVLIIITICLNAQTLSAQNAPISAIGIAETYNDSATVSITVTDFINIGACDLLITYDSTIASATLVSLGPGVGAYYFIGNYLTPGQISVSWLFFQPGSPGLSLPDNSVFLNINFERTGYGISMIEFDTSNQFYCFWADGNYDELIDIPNSSFYHNGSISFDMIDAPVTNAPAIQSCEGSETTDVPITVSDFDQVGAFNLTLQYDPLVFIYQSYTNNSGFPNLFVDESTPGTLIAEGISNDYGGVNLANNSILFTLHFENLGGSTELIWSDSGASCKYMGMAPAYEPRNDLPKSAFYVNGLFSELPLPADGSIITSSSGGMVCGGESGVTFSVSPIAYSDSYEWTIPAGAVIDSGVGTSEISVSFNENAISGNVSVYGINECGDGLPSPDYAVNVGVPPSLTSQPVSPDTVYAGDGVASFSVTASGTDLTYQWQEYTDNWDDVNDVGVYSGSTTSLLTITNPPVSMNGNKYRCIVSGSCDPPAISDGNATLSVVTPSGLDVWDFSESSENKKMKFTAFPNPFSDQVTFAYAVPSKGKANITIITLYGEQVADMTDQIEIQGIHKLSLNANQLPPGVYIASITFKSDTMIIRDQLIIISMKY